MTTQDAPKHREIVLEAMRRSRPKPVDVSFPLGRQSLAAQQRRNEAIKQRFAEIDAHDAAVAWLEDKLK